MRPHLLAPLVLLALPPASALVPSPGATAWLFDGAAETWNGIETGTGCAPFISLRARGDLRLVLADRHGEDTLALAFAGEVPTFAGPSVPCAIVRACAGQGDGLRGWHGRCADALLLNEWHLTRNPDATFAFTYYATTGLPTWYLAAPRLNAFVPDAP